MPRSIRSLASSSMGYSPFHQIHARREKTAPRGTQQLCRMGLGAAQPWRDQKELFSLPGSDDFSLAEKIIKQQLRARDSCLKIPCPERTWLQV